MSGCVTDYSREDGLYVLYASVHVWCESVTVCALHVSGPRPEC